MRAFCGLLSGFWAGFAGVVRVDVDVVLDAGDVGLDWLRPLARFRLHQCGR